MMASIDTSYEPFSREPEYIELNRLFIESLGLQPHYDVLDLACGTGTVTELILGELKRKGAGAPPAARVIGVDLSRQSLTHARKHLMELELLSAAGRSGSGHRGNGVRCRGLVEASGDRIPIADAAMDAVIVANAIQLFDEKDRVAGEVRRVLRPSGLFAFNTSFYAGTYVCGTEAFYRLWMQEALAYIAGKDEEARRSGRPGIRRKRGQVAPASSKPWLSRGEYEAVLDRNGFTIRHVFERTVMLTQRCFETIGSYAGLAGVLLSGYPIEISCEALEKSAGSALATAGMASVPRYWIEVIAVRS